MKVFCILSDDRAMKSLSPAMHSAVLRKLGLDGVYVPFVVYPEHLAEAVKGIIALHIAGANVTVPHKETVIPHLQGLTPEAQAIGAVNTLVRNGDGVVGHNTDADGFLDALSRSGIDLPSLNCLVVGTGGASRAVLHALERGHAAKAVLAGRNPERAASLAARFRATPCALEELPQRAKDAHLLINAASASSALEAPELASLVAKIEAPRIKLIVDLNYGRTDNMWRNTAEKLGADFMDGLPMLACQAARSFFLWTGARVPAERFLEAIGASL
jgi:shikimate dehydrogenase